MVDRQITRPLARRALFGIGASTLMAGLARTGSARAGSLHGIVAHLPARPLPALPPDPRSRPLVVLDPGHGGKDPGAIGITGTYEKHVAFAAATELKRQIDAEGGYRAALTRQRDVFIPLQDRVAAAQRQGAALFVSMHADALSDPGVRGASIYTLASVASDAQSAALAKRENSADRFGDPAFHGVPPEVAGILASLVRQETRAGSARLQHGLVDQLDRSLPMLQNPARHASFAVLRAADIPSVLVEMGFMSNREDEAALRRAEHRAMIAAAMKRAVDAFFAGHALRMG